MTPDQQKAVQAAIEAITELMSITRLTFTCPCQLENCRCLDCKRQRATAALAALRALDTTDALEADRSRVRAEALREFAAKWRASASDGNWLLEMEAEAERIEKETTDGV